MRASVAVMSVVVAGRGDELTGEIAMKLSRLFILAGFAWVVLGMIYGIYLGITNQLNLANSHAHANLVGFVISILFGLLHHNWPKMQASRVAVPQFWVYQIGALMLVAGKYQVDVGGGGALVATGSFVVVLGTLMMGWLFVMKSEK